MHYPMLEIMHLLVQGVFDLCQRVSEWRELRSIFVEVFVSACVSNSDVAPIWKWYTVDPFLVSY